MARLYLFGEGRTEETFADRLLKNHLAKHGVYLHPKLIAHARRRGKTHRGGGRNYEPMRNDILNLLAQEKGSDVYFTTMIDLYGLSTGFPRFDESEEMRHIPVKRVEFLEQAFAEDIGDTRSRFIPYIQLHEYEAILFSDPSCFRYSYERHERQIAELQKIADSYPTPELIDDGPQTAPSKRILAIIPDYEDAKPAVGPDVAELIGLDVIRAKCPHFNAWLSRLESLGT
jgi:Domain of unknown function (DUF4276)